MARYEYVILTQAVDGRLDEFERWYDEVHLRDVLKIPGVVSARRSRISSIKNTAVDGPAWNSLAIYELDAEDPEVVKQAISDAAGTAAMVMTDALNKDGIVQIIAQPLSES